MKSRTFIQAHTRDKRGFSLIETMVSLLIMSLLMLGTMDLFINSFRMASRSTAQVFASQDAAVAMRSIEDQIRESLWLALPDTSDIVDAGNNNTLYFTEALANFPSLSGYGAAQFVAWDSTHTYSADTAMFLATPPVDNSATFDTTAGNPLNGSRLQGVPTYNMYNRGGGYSSGIMIYRADSNGTPDAAYGQYLWELSSGANPTTNRPLISSVDKTTWNSVQFMRPVIYVNGTITQESEYEVQMKITSGYYSAINGQQTNESSNGSSTTQLVGRCVEMRDRELSGPHEPGYKAMPPQSGNKFQKTGGSAPGQAG